MSPSAAVPVAFVPAHPLPAFPSSFAPNALSCRPRPSPVPIPPRPHPRLRPLSPRADLHPNNSHHHRPPSSVDLLTPADPPPIHPSPSDSDSESESESPSDSPPPPADTSAPTQPFKLVAAASAASIALATLFATLSASPDMPSAHSSLVTAVNTFIAGPHFAVSVGMGISAFIQSLTGFGFAIVSVGALTQVPWIAHSSVFNAIQPVAATLGAFTGWSLIIPEISKVNWRTIAVLLLATTITTPLGSVVLDLFDANTVIRGLGALISGYVLYSALGIPVPKKLGGTAAAWGMGFLAGALGGAFDITGPPLVIHGEAAGWDTKNGDFRRNLLAVVTINSSFVVLWDLFAGRLNDYYYLDFVRCAAPTTVVGIVVGKYLGNRLNPATFKKIVLGTCMVMGIKLLFS